MATVSERIFEVERNFKEAIKALDTFKKSDTTSEVRHAWESFLFSFSRSLGKLTALGLAERATRAEANRLKNASNHDDPGLLYLREARNVAEHGLEPTADFTRSSTSFLNGAIYISGDSKNITIGTLKINGEVRKNVEINTLEGKPTLIKGLSNRDIEFSPAKVILVRVRNPENKKEFEPPASVFGVEIVRGSADSLAEAALRGLSDILKDIKSRLPKDEL